MTHDAQGDDFAWPPPTKSPAEDSDNHLRVPIW